MSHTEELLTIFEDSVKKLSDTHLTHLAYCSAIDELRTIVINEIKLKSEFTLQRFDEYVANLKFDFDINKGFQYYKELYMNACKRDLESIAKKHYFLDNDHTKIIDEYMEKIYDILLKETHKFIDEYQLTEKHFNLYRVKNLWPSYTDKFVSFHVLDEYREIIGELIDMNLPNEGSIEKYLTTKTCLNKLILEKLVDYVNYDRSFIEILYKESNTYYKVDIGNDIASRQLMNKCLQIYFDTRFELK